MAIMSEFKTFISRGNVIDMAVGVIVGGMFTNIVNSVVNDILMPIISLLTGRTNFADMFIVLSRGTAPADAALTTLEEAKGYGASVLAYGNLIQLIIQFLITAFCLFLIVKAINMLRDRGLKKDKAEIVEAAAEAADKAVEEAK